VLELRRVLQRNCGGGMCPLNPSCRTANNACTTNQESARRIAATGSATAVCRLHPERRRVRERSRVLRGQMHQGGGRDPRNLLGRGRVRSRGLPAGRHDL
jgi:hypothetical protein